MLNNYTVARITDYIITVISNNVYAPRPRYHYTSGVYTHRAVSRSGARLIERNFTRSMALLCFFFFITVRLAVRAMLLIRTQPLNNDGRAAGRPDDGYIYIPYTPRGNEKIWRNVVTTRDNTPRCRLWTRRHARRTKCTTDDGEKRLRVNGLFGFLRGETFRRCLYPHGCRAIVVFSRLYWIKRNNTRTASLVRCLYLI